MLVFLKTDLPTDKTRPSFLLKHKNNGCGTDPCSHYIKVCVCVGGGGGGGGGVIT